MLKEHKSYGKWLGKWHSILLLFSLVLFLILGPLIQSSELRELFYELIMIVIAVSGFVLIPKSKRGRIFTFLFYLNLVTSFLAFTDLIAPIYLLSNIIWSIFFVKVLVEIFRLSLDPANSSSSAMLNSVSGYIVLGIIGAAVLQYMQDLGLPPFKTDLEFNDLIYYSFVTMTTLGYGDISPDFREGKAVAVAITIAGQLYIAIVIAINLAKYMTRLNEKEAKENYQKINDKLDRLLEERNQEEKS